MSINAEANNSNSSLDQPQRSTVRSLRKQYDTCHEIDGTVERLRRAATAESLQVANLECVDAPPLQPYKPRRAVALPQKVDNMDQCLSTPRAAMTFEDLNGLFKQSTKQGMDKTNSKSSDSVRYRRIIVVLRLSGKLVYNRRA